MKHIIFVCILIFRCSQIYAQGFPVIISSDKDEVSYSLLSQKNDRYYTLITDGTNNLANDTIRLFSFDTNGNARESVQLILNTGCDKSAFRFNLTEITDRNVAFSYCIDHENSDSQIYLIVFDSLMQIVNQDTIGNSSRQDVAVSLLIKNDGNILINSVANDDLGLVYLQEYTFNFEPVQLYNLPYFTTASPYYGGILRLFEQTDNNTITGIFGLTRQHATFDETTLELIDLQYLGYDSSYWIMYLPIFVKEVKRYVVPVLNVESEYNKIDILITDSSFNLLNINSFDFSDQHARIVTSIDYYDSSSIWIAMTSYLNTEDFAEEQQFIKLIKMNSNGEILRETNIGGDVNYVAHAVKVTPDGGALIMCERYDWTIQDHERDIYIYKIDSNGNLVNTATDIEPVDEQKNFLVYPNPAQDVLHFQSAMYEQATVEIFDLNGKKIQEQGKNSFETTLDISNLAPGMYLYKISAEHTLIITGKFVKD